MSTVQAGVFPLLEAMDAIVEIEEDVHDNLVVYRWRPPGPPQLEMGGGAIYNWVPGGPHEIFSVDTWKDFITLQVRVGVRHTDSNDEMRLVELFGSLLVHKLDFALHRIWPMGHPVIKKARRTGFRLVEDTFGDVTVLAVECPVEIEFHRIIPANS